MQLQEAPPQAEHLGQHEPKFIDHMGKVAISHISPDESVLPEVARTKTELVGVAEYQQPHHDIVVEAPDKKAEIIHGVGNAIRSTIHQGMHGETQLHFEDIEWSKVATSLVHQASKIEGDHSEQFNLLRAALVSTEGITEPSERLDFVDTVFATGMARQLYIAGIENDIAIVPDANVVRRADRSTAGVNFVYLKQLAMPFGTHPQAARRYIDVLKSTDVLDKAPKKRLLQKQFAQQFAAGESLDDEQQIAAVEASLHGPKVSGDLLHMHKLERFALQEYFIRKQAEALTPDSDFANSPLATTLRVDPPEVSNAIQMNLHDLVAIPDAVIDPSAVGMLTNDERDRLRRKTFQPIEDLADQTRTTIKRLSEPIINRFTPLETKFGEIGPESKEQLAGRRFRTIIAETKDHREIANFINFANQGRATEFEDATEIWSVAEDGAGTPDFAPDIMQVIIAEARNMASQGDKPTPEELHKVTQDNRRILLGMASSHLEDLIMGDGVILNPYTDLEDVLQNKPQAGSAHLSRGEDGKLQLMSDVTAAGQRDQLDSYMSSALGCPALRVTIDGASEQPPDKKVAYGSKNLVDHTLAIMFNEAYNRGLFDLDNYDPAGLTAALVKRNDDIRAAAIQRLDEALDPPNLSDKA